MSGAFGMSWPSACLALASVGAGLFGCAAKGDRVDVPPKPQGLLPIGSAAPDVSALDQDGKLVRVADLRGRAIVLWFYPKDFTGG